MDMIFGLLGRIDECHDDIVFFADEGGSWQVGVDWVRVLPAWFRCLSRTSGPDEFAGRAVKVVDAFERHDWEKHLANAHRLGTAAQRKALAHRTRRGNGR